ncbi:MAG: DIS3-like exonuclease 2 [Bacillariaceae sp.]|jgi:DIS3-like exonuclease 2
MEANKSNESSRTENKGSGGRGRGRGRGGGGRRGNGGRGNNNKGGGREGNGGRGNNDKGGGRGGRGGKQSASSSSSNTRPESNRYSNSSNGSAPISTVYPRYLTMEECLIRYNAKDPTIIRGTLRGLPSRDAAAFCTCDRGSQIKDVVLDGPMERNRALDGDIVFVELLPPCEEEKKEECDDEKRKHEDKEEVVANKIKNDNDDVQEQKQVEDATEGDETEDDVWWQDDPDQVNLWDPVVPLTRQRHIPKTESSSSSTIDKDQRHGRVVLVVFPKQCPNEIRPNEKQDSKNTMPTKRVVGTIKRLYSGTALLTSSNNKCMQQFRLSNDVAEKYKDAPEGSIFSAKYTYGSWSEHFKWPPCTHVEQFGLTGNIEDETQALLMEFGVDHGEFTTHVLEESQKVVASGQYSVGTESGWKPTSDMYKGRKDYRNQRIFTIDPTTAKDLDDALHVTDLGNGEVEIGVHIADVSFFIPPDCEIDIEAQRRCTTVYLVDRTVPMLPRPLCEVACSLNENVERLAFSCVWRMNRDGSLVKDQEVWYGRTVIKSCARLDYSTAQNIIENKVAYPEENEIDEKLWPISRRPTGGHTTSQVANDVRFMNEIAQARRKLRFQNGAIALSAVKLTFKLDDDRETPLLCEPYPIRDSNKLVEEYMLLANYLVAQRLITHTGPRACLRHHEPPDPEGLQQAADLAMEAIGFNIDIESSESLQRSLNRLGRECQDPILLQCITELLKTPMKPANYIAAGEIPDEAWAHFALHIPYYTHFTSPIRRYADVIVHRLLQASIEGNEAVEDFPMEVKEIGAICNTCNEKKDGSRKAQERSDAVFLALYLRRFPKKKQLGIVMSVGNTAFTVFLPAMGISAVVFLDEHKDWIEYKAFEVPNMGRRINLKRTQRHKGEQWNEILIKNFVRVRVSCGCTDKAPLNVKLELEGPSLNENEDN